MKTKNRLCVTVNKKHTKMATPQQRTMSAIKGLLTKESTYVDMVIEERNYDAMVAERDKLKDLYQRFYLAHEEHLILQHPRN